MRNGSENQAAYVGSKGRARLALRLLFPALFLLCLLFMGCAVSKTEIGPVDLKYTAPPTPKCVNCTEDGLRVGLTFGANTNNHIVATTQSSNPLGVTVNGQPLDPVGPATPGNLSLQEESYSSTLSAAFVLDHSMGYGLAELSDIGGKAYGFYTVGIGKVFGDEDENFVLRMGGSVMDYHLDYQDQEITYPSSFDDGGSQKATVVNESGLVNGARLLPSLGMSYDNLVDDSYYLNLNVDVFHFFDYLPLGIEHTVIPISLYVSPKVRSRIHPIFGVEYSVNTLDLSSPAIKFSAGIEI